jgi:YVTN family beta-propeller protein
MTRRRFLWLLGFGPLALAACGQATAPATTPSPDVGSPSATPAAVASVSPKPSVASAGAAASAKPSASAAPSAAPQTVAVFNVGSKDVTLIDAARNEVVDTKPLGAAVRWLGEEQAYWDGKLIWTYDFPDNKLEVLAIDPSSWQVTKRIPAGTGPAYGVILSQDRKTAAVTAAGDNKLLTLDTASGAQLHAADTGKYPCDLDNSSDYRFLYVPERDQDTVAMFNAADLTLVKRVSFPAGSKPHMLRVAPDGLTLWVQTDHAGTNSVLRASDLTVLATEQAGKMPVTVAFSPDSKWALVPNAGEDTATLFDGGTFKPVKSITVGQGPTVVSFRGDGKFAYVALMHENSVAVIDTGSWTVAKTLKAGQQPQGIVILPPNPR